MKKQKENQPIDNLFARRLGNLSLTPGSDSFERLQARMGQGKVKARVVFWRNPAAQRYMAMAACLLLVCLFGWLYWQSASNSLPGEPPVANQLSKSLKRIQQIDDREVKKAVPEVDVVRSQAQEKTENQLAIGDKPEVMSTQRNQPASVAQQPDKSNIQPAIALGNKEPASAQIPVVDSKIKVETTPITDITPARVENTERLAENTVKPSAPAERVLTVTIEEPASLVAARQAVKTVDEEKTTVAAGDMKPSKEPKGGSLWQQVKKVKQGELFARHDSQTRDDRGLLGRAYNGLKQSFEKDKSEK